jgi:hypothetical protein
LNDINSTVESEFKGVVHKKLGGHITYTEYLEEQLGCASLVRSMPVEEIQAGRKKLLEDMIQEYEKIGD